MPESLHILLIDGNDKDRDYYAQRLKRSSPDHVVSQAATGQYGLSICVSQPIDCVVLEIALPDMSGFEVLTKLVPRAYAPDIPVVVLTRFTNEGLFELALKNGAQACLQKSNISGDLLEKTILKATAAIRKEFKIA